MLFHNNKLFTKENLYVNNHIIKIKCERNEGRVLQLN